MSEFRSPRGRVAVCTFWHGTPNEQLKWHWWHSVRGDRRLLSRQTNKCIHRRKAVILE